MPPRRKNLLPWSPVPLEALQVQPAPQEKSMPEPEELEIEDESGEEWSLEPLAEIPPTSRLRLAWEVLQEPQEPESPPSPLPDAEASG